MFSKGLKEDTGDHRCRSCSSSTPLLSSRADGDKEYGHSRVCALANGGKKACNKIHEERKLQGRESDGKFDRASSEKLQ